MRISDWSSDVCSSDLTAMRDGRGRSLMSGKTPIGWAIVAPARCGGLGAVPSGRNTVSARRMITMRSAAAIGDRKSVVSGESVSVRVDLGGRRILKQKNKHHIVSSYYI